jgi:phospholipid/cholesterol/gamma-HCH transport system ATP-binding protein
MTAPLIRFRHVRKSFGPKVVFSDLTLDLFRGETVTILGASGSGKSVMLKMLIGLLPADGGEILFKGRDVVKMSEEELTDVRWRIAYLFRAELSSTPCPSGKTSPTGCASSTGTA